MTDAILLTGGTGFLGTPVTVDPKALATIRYTSGTTGDPI